MLFLPASSVRLTAPVTSQHSGISRLKPQTAKILFPIIASAGISAFPIATRVAQKEAFRYDSGNIILNDALALNSASQLASAVIGGLVLAVVG